LPRSALAELIRPAGYFNVKAKRLHNFIAHLVERHEGKLDSLFSSSIDDLRAELLSINGVGFETADSMILYAAEKPIFVVDAYTVRALRRHDLLEDEADYLSVQAVFHDHLPRDVALYNDFHAQFVAVGAAYCKRTPRCGECPLGVFRETEEG
jgi:endonuclease-3 related protein